jgi:hypothetical protein
MDMIKTYNIMFILFFLITGFISVGIFNYLLFHTLIELFSILIAFMVFVVAIYSFKNADKKTAFLLFLGVSLGAVGFFELLHTLAYPGIGIFPSSDSNLTVQIWIVSRYIESLSFLLTFMLIGRNIQMKNVHLLLISCAADLSCSVRL